MSEWLQELSMWVYGAVGALMTGVYVTIRKVTTNERQIMLLENEIRLRREFDLERYIRLESSLEEVKKDLKILIHNTK